MSTACSSVNNTIDVSTAAVGALTRERDQLMNVNKTLENALEYADECTQHAVVDNKNLFIKTNLSENKVKRLEARNAVMAAKGTAVEKALVSSQAKCEELKEDLKQLSQRLTCAYRAARK